MRPWTLAAIVMIATQLGCPDDPKEDRWTEAFDAEETGWLLNAWGPSNDHLFAVGGTPENGLIMEKVGGAWAPVELGVDVPLLNWIFGFGDDDLIAVGREGTIIRWDGSSWSIQETPTTEDLWGVWGTSPENLWAVGGRGRAEGQATILRWDGDSWQTQDIPELERANVWAIFKVWGTSADNVLFVGQRGAVLRWNGSELVEELVGASDDLISVWGTGPDNIVAVGGRSTGVVSRYDGSSWTTESLAPLPGLNGVWLGSPGTIHAVGAVGTLLTIDTETLEPTQTFASTDLDFHAVFGTSDELLAVGGNLLAAEPPYRGIAFERAREDSQ